MEYIHNMKIKDWNLFTESSYFNPSVKELCDTFLKEVQSMSEKNLLYRGVFSTDGGTKIGPGTHLMNSRKDRKPGSTAPEISNLIDEFSEQKFGLKIRKEGIFTSKLYNVANGYGDAYIFLPVGDYKYVWNYNVDDLFTHIVDEDWYPDTYTQREIINTEGFFDMKSYVNRKEVRNEVKNIVDKYVLGGPNNSSLSEVGIQEVTFFCDQYVLLDTSYDEMERGGMIRYK